MTDTTVFLIWSHEHGMWWRPNSAGYTNYVHEAGQYTEDESADFCSAATRGWSGDGTPPEVMVALADDDWAYYDVRLRLNETMAYRVREATDRAGAERAIAEREAGA